MLLMLHNLYNLLYHSILHTVNMVTLNHLSVMQIFDSIPFCAKYCPLYYGSLYRFKLKSYFKVTWTQVYKELVYKVEGGVKTSSGEHSTKAQKQVYIGNIRVTEISSACQKQWEISYWKRINEGEFGKTDELSKYTSGLCLVNNRKPFNIFKQRYDRICTL